MPGTLSIDPRTIARMSSKSNKMAKAQARTDRAAELRAEADRARRAAFIQRGAIVAALVLVVIVATVFISSRDSSDVVASEAGSSDYGLVVGDTAAPHEIVIYEDFLCPVCGVFEEAAGEMLSEVAATGDAVVDYRAVSFLSRFGDYSADAVNALLVVQEESGDEVAKELHDLLFADQPEESGPFPDDDWLVAKAVEAGADEAAVRPGIEDGARLADVEAATAEAEEAGVRGTPTVLLDGVVFEDGDTWEERTANLREALS